MKYIAVTFLALLQWLLLPGPATAECIFDSRLFSKRQYAANTLVRHVDWSAKTAEAKIITKQADLISVKHWSCDVAGLSATMLVHPAALSHDELKAKLTNFGRIVLQGPELQDFLNQISRNALAPGETVNITGPENRPEFSYRIDEFPDYYVLQIEYYYN